MESHRRAITKAVTWRLVALAITACTVWVITGRISVAVSVGAFETALKLGAYYGHERLWSRMDFGRTVEPDRA